MSESLSGISQIAKEIPLTRGLVALVDHEDYELLSMHKWMAHATGYAIRKVTDPAIPWGQSEERMHRVILGLSNDDKRIVDHIDGNRANNQRSNLRIATKYQNSLNRRLNINNTSGYKGVSFHKCNSKWAARINISGKTMILGYFKSPEVAYEAYKTAAIKFHGEFANFG